MFSFSQEERRLLLFIFWLAIFGIASSFLSRRNAHIESVLICEEGIGKIELNSATYEMLLSLPGVGPQRARKILEYRYNHNGFRKLKELRNIKGFSASLIRRLSNYLWVKQ